MGEAGPEAILPLKRGANGKLGVTVTGGASGSSGSPVVNITVNSSSETKQDGNGNAALKELSGRIKTAVVEVLIVEKRPGGLLYA